MKQKTIIMLVLVAVLVLFGAGCSDKDQEQSEEELAPKIELTWHNVILFSGSGDGIGKNTQPFSIKGNQWRINWDFQDSGEFGDKTNGLFIINIYRVSESVITDQVSYSGLSTSDISYIYEGEGDFYLDITTANSKEYSITIEDLY